MNKSRQIVILLALFLIGGITMVNAQDKPPLLDRPTVGCPKTQFCGYFFCSTFGPIMSAINILAHCWGHEMQH
ncbi:hypothetical protein BuS5_00828 [Desulfosarcina sp. BuS5]|nr:hypothetical protein BuS5_00828 [Desulfosarcina sp. BuS5]